MRIFARSYLTIILLLSVFITSTFLNTSSVYAKVTSNDITELIKKKEFTWTDFDQFAKKMDEENKFYAIHLNGKLNYPSLISPKVSPSEIVDLAQDPKRGTLSKKDLQKRYSQIFDNYFAYFAEDSSGNQYLIIIDQLVKVKIQANLDQFLLTVDSKHYKNFKNNGSVELKKGQTYKIKIEEAGYQSFEQTVDLTGDKYNYVVKAELESTSNWLNYIIGIFLGAGLIWVIYKRFGPTSNKRPRKVKGSKGEKINAREEAVKRKQVIQDPPLVPVHPSPLPLTQVQTITIAGVELEGSILNDDSEVEHKIKLLKRKINEPMHKLEFLLKETMDTIIIEKSKGDNPEISTFLRRYHPLETAYKDKKGHLENDIEQLRELKYKIEPHKHFKHTIEEILDSYNSLLAIFFQICQLSNDVSYYKYEQNKRLGNVVSNTTNDVLNQDVMDMIKNVVMPMFQNLENRIQDLQSNVSSFSKLFESMEEYIESKVMSRITALESIQEQNILEILELREEIIRMPDEIRKEISKSRNGIDEQLNRKLERFKTEIEDKIQTVNDTVIQKLEQLYNNDRFYQSISNEIKQKIGNNSCHDVVINSLSIGRYLFYYQKDAFKKDASIIYLAYCKALEKIFNPKDDKRFKFAEFIKGNHLLLKNFKVDFESIRDKRNAAAHTKTVKLDDVEKLDRDLLEGNSREEVLIVKLIRDFTKRIF